MRYLFVYKHSIPGKTPNKTYFVSLLASFANSCGVFFLDHGKLKSDMTVADGSFI